MYVQYNWANWISSNGDLKKSTYSVCGSDSTYRAAPNPNAWRPAQRRGRGVGRAPPLPTPLLRRQTSGSPSFLFRWDTPPQTSLSLGPLRVQRCAEDVRDVGLGLCVGSPCWVQATRCSHWVMSYMEWGCVAAQWGEHTCPEERFTIIRSHVQRSQRPGCPVPWTGQPVIFFPRSLDHVTQVIFVCARVARFFNCHEYCSLQNVV